MNSGRIGVGRGDKTLAGSSLADSLGVGGGGYANRGGLAGTGIFPITGSGEAGSISRAISGAAGECSDSELAAGIFRLSEMLVTT